MKKKIQYNHNRKLDDFSSQLETLRSHGFTPIAVSQMYFEDVFVFKTTKEAKDAYNKLERSKNGVRINKLVGWYYGKKDFIKTIEEYKSSPFNCEVLVHWLT